MCPIGRPATREHKIAMPDASHLLKDSQRRLGKRHSMLASGLDPRGGHYPQPLGHVDLLPTGTDDLARPRHGQNAEFKSSRADTLFST